MEVKGRHLERGTEEKQGKEWEGITNKVRGNKMGQRNQLAKRKSRSGRRCASKGWDWYMQVKERHLERGTEENKAKNGKV